MPLPYPDYIRDLQRSIGCPNQWSRFRLDWEFRRILFYYWAEIAQEYQADREMHHYFQYDCLQDADVYALKAIQTNADIWRPRAIADYQTKTRFFDMFRHQDAMEHQKHWLTLEKGLPDILSSTISGPAKYLFRYPLPFLERALYDTVKFNWRRIAEGRVPHLYVAFKRVIGASQGKAAHHVRFDLDYSKGEVHSHPIQQEEKPADQPWLSDIFQQDIWPDISELHLHATIDEEIEWDFGEESNRALQPTQWDTPGSP